MLRHDDSAARKIIEDDFGKRVCDPFVGLVFIDDKDVPYAGCIVNNYDGRDAHLTLVSQQKLDPVDVRALAKYLFEKLDCHRCTAITARHNAKARKALRQLGFNVEGFMREHFPNDDAVIYGLLRSEQKIARI